VFGWLAKVGGLDQAELVRTFNCGIGMIAVVGPEDADRVAAALSAAGEKVVRFGEMVTDPDGPRTLFEGALEV
jgi:phosphoribosylformylglycinamidine cyclo-ligase